MRRWGDDGITEPGTEQGREPPREFWERGGAGDSRPSGVGEAVAGRTTGSVEKPDTGAAAACATMRAAGGDSSRGMATMRGGGLQEFRVELQTLPWDPLLCRMDSRSSAKSFRQTAWIRFLAYCS